MAEVSIDIDAMASLVSAIESAKTSVPDAGSSVRNHLSQVWLSAPSVDKVAYGSAIESWLETSLRDLNRRLALARMIAESTPGLSVVSFDDSVVSTKTPAEIDALVKQVLDKVHIDEDDLGASKDLDPDLIKILDENSLDPYFAQALATKLSPDALSQYLLAINRGHQKVMGDDGALADWNHKYDALLRGFGNNLGLASQGTGDLAVPGMAKAWSDLIEKSAGFHTGTANVLSLVVSRGDWSTDFLTSTYETIRKAEDGNAGIWTMGGFDLVIDPNPDWTRDNGQDGAVITDDPLRGWYLAMTRNVDAVNQLFGSGDTTTITTGDGKTAVVNKEMWDALHARDGIDPTTIDAMMQALAAGIGAPPKEGEQAFQVGLAQNLKDIGDAFDYEAKEAEKKEGPLWKRIAHTILDVVGLIPFIGEPADFVNGVWYYADGDVINGSLSMGSVIPFVGYAFSGGKWVKTAIKADELAELTKLAKDGKTIQLFAKDGTKLDDAIDLADPKSFDPERFLSPTELKIWSGNREFMRKLIAGNRFNAFLYGRYDYKEVALVTGNKRPFRLDSYTPGEAIVSRKLTQLGEGGVSEATALKYIDEFATKYPAGTKIADTPANVKAGIAGDRLDGKMVLEVPPQAGKIDDAVLQHAFEKNIHIVDINGVDYTQALFDAARKGK